jgi:glutamate racemase
MSLSPPTPRLLFIDSGLGGLTVIRAVRNAIPEAAVRFVADDAGFPYGTKDDAILIERLVALVQSAARGFRPDVAVLACNTASTVALTVMREKFAFPIVGTVPAIKPAAALTRTGLVSVLATPGTVAREYTRSLVAKFGGGARFTLVGSPRLAALAEMHGSGDLIDDAMIRAEIEPCFLEAGGVRTDVVVLGCTHYPLLIDKLEALAPWPVVWVDPAPAIARRIANVLAENGHIVGVGAKPSFGEVHFTSGRPPSPALAALLKIHHLNPLASIDTAFAA